MSDLQPGSTRGQKLAGLDFNPSGDPRVRLCKEGFAGLIDQMGTLALERSDDRDVVDIAMEATKHMVTAQMWAVKALTWK